MSFVMPKFDFKKEYKQIYKASEKTPRIVTSPKMQFVTISGEGNPNSSGFNEAIVPLYAIAYIISMSNKNESFDIPNYYPFVVPPLEGIWDIKHGTEFDINDKANLVWEISIALPTFVTNEIFDKAKEIAYHKKRLELINKLTLKTYEESTKCVFMHIGSFDLEKHSFEIMSKYIADNGYKRKRMTHKEIYLSDFRKTETDKTPENIISTKPSLLYKRRSTSICSAVS